MVAARRLRGRWIAKLSPGARAQWAEPLAVLLVRVRDGGATAARRHAAVAVRRAEAAAAARGEAWEGVALATAAARSHACGVERQRRAVVWPNLEASLRRLLAQLARAAYLGDEV